MTIVSHFWQSQDIVFRWSKVNYIFVEIFLKYKYENISIPIPTWDGSEYEYMLLQVAH